MIWVIIINKNQKRRNIMGEIAESLINGEFDYITGEYLGEGDRKSVV